MVKEIRIYVEGGGDGSESKAAVQRGFGQFLHPLRQRARVRRIRWQVVACGGRNAAFDAFKTALRIHPAAFNILLVDAEGFVAAKPWHHLSVSDGWQAPPVDPDQCHLMVQAVEAWLIADPKALADFYGQGFHARSLPARHDVESVDRRDLVPALEQATRNTSKGTYHKIEHCPKILARLDQNAVRSRAPHCDRLFHTVERLVG
jgi:hypothetical protein